MDSVIVVVALLMILSGVDRAAAATRIGFYDSSCPRVEAVVRSTVKAHMSGNPLIGAGVLRLHFHDCFVRGCDASVLLDGPASEKTALSNLGLRGFEVIDDAKTQLEAACPGVVSCADVLALAARDAVSESGGQSWPVPLGRRDGRVSSASDASSLPSPLDSFDQLKQKFSAKGLTTLDLVTLSGTTPDRSEASFKLLLSFFSGAHTLGQTDCRFFSHRLYNFSSTGSPDSSLSPQALSTMQQQCPQGDPGLNKVALDLGSQDSFDNSYFRNLRQGNGVLESDQHLNDDPTAQLMVRSFSVAPFAFRTAFIGSMLRMSTLDVLSESDGEIRKTCSSVN